MNPATMTYLGKVATAAFFQAVKVLCREKTLAKAAAAVAEAAEVAMKGLR